MSRIIGIAGGMGSGKDTFGKMLQKHLDKDYEIVKFGYAVKQIASIILNVPVERFEDEDFKKAWLGEEWENHVLPFEEPYTVRILLQRIGTEAGRYMLHPDIWVNNLFNKFANHSYWIITDLRFPNEFEAIKKRGGYTIKIVRGVGYDDSQHISERALDNHNFDLVVHNIGDLEMLDTIAAKTASSLKPSFNHL
jgi:hypothetical protein